MMRRVLNKRLWITFCKYGIGLALLAWVVWSHWEPSNGSPGLKEALQREIHFGPLLIAVAICAASLLLTFVRWYFLVRAQDLPFSLRNALRLGMAGYAFSTLLPGSVGGDIVKAAFLAREQNRRTVAVATVIFDRILGLSGLFWLVALAGTVFWLIGDLQEAVLGTIILGAWAICGACVLFWLLLGLLPRQRAESFADWLGRLPRVGGPLAEVWRTVWMYRCRGHSIWLALVLAIVGHIGFVAVFYFAALTLFPVDALPSLKQHYLTIPVGLVIQAGIPLPGGIGGGEFAFGKLYELIGFAFASGVLASLIQRVVTWCLALVCYLGYLCMRPSLQSAASATAPHNKSAEELAIAEV